MQILLKEQVFWAVMLFHWVSSSQCLEGSQCLHLHGLFGPLVCEDEGFTVLWNSGLYSHDTLSHRRSPESSAVLLFECHILQVLLHIKYWCDTVSSGNAWNLCLQVLGRVNLVTGHVKTQLIAHDKEVYDIAFSRAGGGRDMFASVGECW